MGSFNSLYVKCKSCGELVEFQTKAGDCSMKTLSLNTISLSEIEDLDGDSTYCGSCKELNTLRIETVVKPKFKVKVD